MRIENDPKPRSLCLVCDFPNKGDCLIIIVGLFVSLNKKFQHSIASFELLNCLFDFGRVGVSLLGEFSSNIKTEKFQSCLIVVFKSLEERDITLSQFGRSDPMVPKFL